MSAFNCNPIKIDAPMTQTFWQTLRAAGLLGSQFGKPIQVTQIYWRDPGAGASVTITDGMGTADNNILAEESTPLDFASEDPYNITTSERLWRDWQVTELTAGEIIIHHKGY
jgi:hypothetical protein